jgi:hypothetical protein
MAETAKEEFLTEKSAEYQALIEDCLQHTKEFVLVCVTD